MKVAIAASGRDLSSRMADVFGRCPYFLLVDTHSGAVEARQNPGRDAPGGAGVEAARFVLAQGAQVVIAPRVGPKADAVFGRAGVLVLCRTGCSAAAALHDIRSEEAV